MSRSHRKTPIFPNSTASSERWDKKQWHKRWRINERQRLACASLEEMSEHIASSKNEVCNPWLMNKDGKHFLSLKEQKNSIDWTVEYKAKRGEIAGEHEKEMLKKRMQHRWMGK